MIASRGMISSGRGMISSSRGMIASGRGMIVSRRRGMGLGRVRLASHQINLPNGCTTVVTAPREQTDKSYY